VILAAALLVLLGLGLFVGGILTGATVLYWSCVATCAVAGVCLLLARARMSRAPAAPVAPTRGAAPVSEQVPAASTAAGPPTGATAVSATAVPVAASAGGDQADDAAPAPADQRAPAGSAGQAPGEPPSTAAHAPRGTRGAPDPSGEPPVEEVEVTDLLVVVDLRDEVLVVDEHPRYHLGGCRWLAGRETFPLPLDEARTDGFTPCAWCEPDRTLAQRDRERRRQR
jgi:hypothetical protein